MYIVGMYAWRAMDAWVTVCMYGECIDGSGPWIYEYHISYLMVFDIHIISWDVFY